MPSPMAMARRSPALRATDFSNLCWTCLVAQRRQLSSSSLRASTLPRAGPSTPKDAYQLARNSRRRRGGLFSQVTEQQRLYAREEQGSAEGSRSFHTSSTTRQEALATRVTTPQKVALTVPQHLEGLTTREYLIRWNEQYGVPNKDLLDELGIEAYGSLTENLARLTSPNDLRDIKERDDNEDNHSTAAFLDHADTLDESLADKMLKMGDLVEISFVGEREPVIAVFIAQYGMQGQFYSQQGKWFHRRVKQVLFSVPDFVDKTLLEPIVPFLPKGEVTEDLVDSMQTLDVNAPREIAAPVLKILQKFTEEADAAYRRNASVLDRAHQILAHDADLRFGTLQKITDNLFRSRGHSIPTLYAVRKALLRQPLGFQLDKRSHRQTGVFQIMPVRLKNEIEQAIEWIREFQDEISSNAAGENKGKEGKKSEGATNVRNFITKARRLIDESRSMRDFTPYGRVGISKVRTPITEKTTAMTDYHSEKFSETDAVIIRFIEAWCISMIFHHNTRMGALPPVILRAINKYPDQQLDFVTGFTFLQEIGVIPPHENRTKFDPHLLLPTASHSRPLEQMYSTLVRLGERRDQLGLKDSMAAHRKDWGRMAVYCVDSASAEEIDDGVSIERIPGSADCWVHVHIANPTAFLPREHLMAKMAGHLTESIYMPERTYPMLPKWMSDERLSLGKNRPCLTISTKLNEKGEILDNKIQSGFIRNFIPLTPQTLHYVVDESGAKAAESQPDKVLVVGGDVPQLPKRKMMETEDLTDGQKEELRHLHRLALARQQRRTEAGGIFWNQNYPEMSVFHDHSNAGLPWSHPSRSVARFTKGDPVIQLVATPTESWFQPAGTGSDLMVREMMLLAGEVGALWCRNRNVPSIYRGTVARPDMISIDEYREKYILPTADAKGNPPAKVAFNYLAHAGASVTSRRPLPHNVLGVQQYAKLTSPLRRYGDMLMHWQIESALRYEAKHGRSSLVGRNDGVKDQRSIFAFTAAEVDLITGRLAPRERLISKTKRASQAFWLTQLFFRAYYYGETKLPETLEVVVFSVISDQPEQVAVLSQDYSFDLDMITPPEGAEVGDRWQVRIIGVDSYNRRVFSEPLRLISRETLPDWIDL